MQYLNKSFTVSMMANTRDITCACGKLIKVGYQTKWGLLCPDCHNAKIKEEKEKYLKELKSKMQDSGT
jgi:hypothetical protein